MTISPSNSVVSQIRRSERENSTSLLSGGIDRTQLAIADAPVGAVPFSFLVLGDTDAGLSAGSRATGDFSAAFARQLFQQLGDSRFVLHTGDVTYPLGTYQSYLEGFLQPYQALLKRLPERAGDRSQAVIFERPLLPVPGNHDYADLAGMARVRQRLLRMVCDRLRQLLGIDLGCYGGQGGEAYDRTFLDDLEKLSPERLTAYLAAHYSAPVGLSCDEARYCLNYQPGQFTRLPNRYYSFRYGGVDFFALDSNTWNTAPTAEQFDREQLDWLEQRLIQSWQTPGTVGRILYLHHSPYTTEVTRWQQPETLWVRRHLRDVLNRVAEALGRSPAKGNTASMRPLVDIAIGGHAHCLEHVRTISTGQADADMDWVVCGGSGVSVRRQQPSDGDILENISRQGRTSPEVVAKSQLYAGVRGQGAKKQTFHSFMRIDVRPQQPQPFSIVPFIVTRTREGWQTRPLKPLALGGQSITCPITRQVTARAG